MTSWTAVYWCRRSGGTYHTRKMGGKRDKMKVDIWTLLVLNMGEVGSIYIYMYVCMYIYIRKFVREFLTEGIDDDRRTTIK
jgi:hypothetical protein